MSNDSSGSARYGRYLGLALITIAVASGWILFLPPPSVSQPVNFNHARHAALACVVCHRGAESSARADIPSVDLCHRCHATAPPGVAALLWKEPVSAQAIAWVQVTRMPDHVMFSHLRHVGVAKLECAACHADIGRSTVPPARAPIRLDMNGCLSCHTNEGVSTDCAACHR